MTIKRDIKKIISYILIRHGNQSISVFVLVLVDAKVQIEKFHLGCDVFAQVISIILLILD